ncbi:MAG: type I DNA topoisomerase [Chloroflexota bacterium]|nr:type I DNA topoisomerase [Chloroflexota bacterium]
MNLIVVESPTKAKALRGFLGRSYRVLATMGHIRDLPPKKLGVDTERDFRPTYWFRRGGKQRAGRIKEAAGQATCVYLATDPDREGEAIAWHVAEVIGTTLGARQPQRITFHEVTREAVHAALAEPRALDQALVDAQQARRILDRLVGYQVSPVLWKAIRGRKGLSAGRVQTVALRLVVERDREIESFDPQEYWLLEVELSKITSQKERFRARLAAVDGEKPDLRTEEDVRPIIDRIETADYRVLKVERKRKRRKPYPPYTTSTLQQDVAGKLHWGASKTMRVAQQLYEGVALPGEGTVGLITYMRTDSTFVAQSAQDEAREVIGRYWGADHLPDSAPHYVTRSKVAQEAHEAIRPTSAERTPKAMREHLTADQRALYQWVWRRFIASQMKPALYNDTTVDVVCARGGEDLPYLFRASGRELLSEGFMAVYPVRWSQRSSHKLGAANQDLPSLTLDEPLVLHEVIPEQRFTEPPPHFTESSLIKELDRRGIGRPSTYAGILRTLFQRKYVSRRGASIQAQPLGHVVCDFLVKQFPDLFDVGFTAEMEEDLDRIARGERPMVQVLSQFYEPFETALAAARRAAQEQTVTVPRPKDDEALTREKCPECGGDVVVRQGKYGRFRACSNFPDCRWSAPLVVGTCPKCGGELMERRGKQGLFWGCSNYPDCRYRQRPGDVAEGEAAS